MSRAVLVLDGMPLNCSYCPCYNARWSECYAVSKKIETPVALDGERPDWCPLKEMPEKKPELVMDIVHHESLECGFYNG